MHVPPITYAQWKLLHPVVVKLNSEEALVELYARYREARAIANYFNRPVKRSWFSRVFQGNTDVLDKPRDTQAPDSEVG